MQKQSFSIRGAARSLAAVLIVLVAAPSTTNADGANTVESIRNGLTSYGQEYAAGLKALASLQRLVAGESASRAGAEARFLRAAIAADLQFLARYGNDSGLQGRLTAIFGVAPGRLNATIAAQLAELERGMFAAPVAQVRELLALSESVQSAGLDSVIEATAGAARDALLLRHAAGAIGGREGLGSLAQRLGHRPAPPPTEPHEAQEAMAKAAKGSTQPSASKGAAPSQSAKVVAPATAQRPRAAKRTEGGPGATEGVPSATESEPEAQSPPGCGEGSKPCTQGSAPLASQSQELLVGLKALQAAYVGVAQAARSGDLLARALMPAVNGHMEKLSEQSLLVAEQLAADQAPLAIGDGGTPIIPRVTLVVTETGVRYGTAPTIRIDKTGTVGTLRTPSTWPQTADLEVPDSHWGSTRHYDDVAKAVEPICKGDDPSVVGILAGPEANTAVFSTLLRALSQSGCGPVALLARDSNGMPVGLQLDVAIRGSAAASRHPVLVRVKPRGYTVTSYGNTVDCPRKRDKSGVHHFQLERLGRLLNSKRRAVAAVSYVGWSRLSNVTDVLWHAAAPTKPVSLIVP